jgi:Fur family ferric uptake transcriptional regulator/Fur family peroxide stress response transcriptional regulator
MDNIKRRNTKQRNIIYEIVSSTDTHPTADWIYEKARKIIPNISLGTVYRNLNILKEEGKIVEIQDSRQSRFDAKTDSHFHFKCEICGGLYDVEKDEVSVLTKLEEKGYEIKDTFVILNGICYKCKGN